MSHVTRDDDVKADASGHDQLLWMLISILLPSWINNIICLIGRIAPTDYTTPLTSARMNIRESLSTSLTFLPVKTLVSQCHLIAADIYDDNLNIHALKISYYVIT
jgi:hypothetical protein